MLDRIYFDHASSTPCRAEILKSYIELLGTHYVNSESLYDEGIAIKKLLQQSRKSIAQQLAVKENEIIFTSGASEANNMAIKGLCEAHPERKHIITTKIEHSSVLEVYKQLERLYNYDVTYLEVDRNGQIDINQLKDSIRSDTLLISIIWVNNELGSINDIDAIKRLIKQYPKTFLHVDAVQALGKIDVDFTGIDLVSISAHKINGLIGSGMLIKKHNIVIEPLIIAGQQEGGLRGGTTDALKHIMMAKTVRLALDDMRDNNSYIDNLTDYLIGELRKQPQIKLNSTKNYGTHIINFSTNVKSEVMLNALNQRGIMVSALSTCHSNKTISHVLEAVGLDNKRIRNSLRVSLAKTNTIAELDYFIRCIKEIMTKYGKN